MNTRYAFVLMIQPKWWNGFLHRLRQGKLTHSYVQHGVAPPRDASLLLFYVTKPVGEVAGYAELIERKVGDADEVWKEHSEESVLSSKKEFDEFIGNVQKVSFVRFRNLHQAATPIALDNVLMLLGLKRLSRKGFYLSKDIADKMLAFME